MQAEGLRGCPLEDIARALGYRRDPNDDARWRRFGSVVTINRFMFYDHLCGERGAGAVDLVVHRTPWPSSRNCRDATGTPQSASAHGCRIRRSGTGPQWNATSSTSAASRPCSSPCAATSG